MDALLPVAPLLKTQYERVYHPGAFKAQSGVGVLVVTL